MWLVDDGPVVQQVEDLEGASEAQVNAGSTGTGETTEGSADLKRGQLTLSAPGKVQTGLTRSRR